MTRDELRRLVSVPAPVPEEALRLLHETAQHDTGGSQAARYFLFWLAGEPDPTGFQGDGGLELRRLDKARREAALQILTWWGGPTRSDEPLYLVLRALQEQWGTKPTSPAPD